MINIKYNSWWDTRKRIQSIENTLAQLDLYNKTNYAKQDYINEETLEIASKNAHINENVYFVLILDNDKPINALEINKDFFRVKFIDDKHRKYLSYDFQGTDKKMLFLSSATYWEYNGDSDKIVKITNYIFKEDGKSTIIERDKLTNEQITYDSKNKIEISGNYEDYPSFGDYKNLIRKERYHLD